MTSHSPQPRPQPRPLLDDRGLPPGSVIRPEYEVTPRQLADMLTSPGTAPLILDVRLPSETAIGAIAGSLNIPLHHLETRVDEVVDAAAGRAVVTICHHGVRSLKASLFLRQAGVGNALSMAGGMDCWSIAIDPTIPRYERNGDACRIVS